MTKTPTMPYLRVTFRLYRQLIEFGFATKRVRFTFKSSRRMLAAIRS